MRLAALALALCACGRIGFGGIDRDGGDGSIGDDGGADSSTDADIMIAGESVVMPPGSGANNLFGYALALSADGHTLAIGAYGETNLAGAVYVYVNTSGTWTQQARLEASNHEAQDVFGYALAISAEGNSLIVGAPDEDGGATTINGDGADNSKGSAGAAYVFARAGTTWAQQAYLKASNSDPSDNFGCAVAISADGGTAVVGAYTEDSSVSVGPTSNSNLDSGAAYVFTRVLSSWTEQAILKAPNADPND